MTVMERAYTVASQDDQPNGLVNVLVALLSQNLENFPARRAIATRMSRPIAVYSTDTDQVATVRFERDQAFVSNGIVGRPSVAVHATVAQVLDVAQLQMRAGGLVPVGFATARGMRVLGQILRHKLVVKGLLTHTISSLRFIALISVAG
jgi:hypothetical protein